MHSMTSEICALCFPNQTHAADAGGAASLPPDGISAGPPHIGASGRVPDVSGSPTAVETRARDWWHWPFVGRRCGRRALLWKQEHEGAPDAFAPVEFVVMAFLCFFPLRVRQARSLQLLVREGLFLHKVLQVFAVFPANAAQFLDDGDSMAAAIVIAGEIDGAAIEIKPGRFYASVVRLKDLLDEVTFFNLKCAGEACGCAEGFRVFPREGDAANPTHGRAEHGGVACGFLCTIFL